MFQAFGLFAAPKILGVWTSVGNEPRPAVGSADTARIGDKRRVPYTGAAFVHRGRVGTGVEQTDHFGPESIKAVSLPVIFASASTGAAASLPGAPLSAAVAGPITRRTSVVIAYPAWGRTWPARPSDGNEATHTPSLHRFSLRAAAAQGS